MTGRALYYQWFNRVQNAISRADKGAYIADQEQQNEEHRVRVVGEVARGRPCCMRPGYC